MKLQRELATPALCEELLPLLEAHYQEIAHFKDIKLEPDFEQYIRVEEAGSLRVFTARDEDNALFGYAIYFVRANIHYKSSVQAVQDILYVHPQYRGIGAKLIAHADRELAKEGVQAVYHHVKSEHNFGPLLERMGYKLVDLIYAKRLD